MFNDKLSKLFEKREQETPAHTCVEFPTLPCPACTKAEQETPGAEPDIERERR
jgi:enamine deaminase RidA (YjgF/YER057c/UK114 family)